MYYVSGSAKYVYCLSSMFICMLFDVSNDVFAYFIYKYKNVYIPHGYIFCRFVTELHLVVNKNREATYVNWCLMSPHDS